MAQPPTIAHSIGLCTPIFLRKLRNSGSFGFTSTPQTQRARDWLDSIWRVEPHPESPFSLFLVNTDDDFHRVILGIGSKRRSPFSDAYFLPILPCDLDSVGLTPTQIDAAELDCPIAKRLHYHLESNEDQLLKLCTRLLLQQRPKVTLKEKAITMLGPKATEDGCLSLSSSLRCIVSGCDAIRR